LIFSLRYYRPLSEKRMQVALSDDARRKITACIEKYNASMGVQRDPNDGWISNSSVVEEAILELLSERGWDDIPGTDAAVKNGKHYDAFRHLMREGESSSVFDFIELSMAQMGTEDREKCRVKINQIFDLHECPWRIADGEFFKLDSDFMGERLAATAHDALAANQFVGAADEYAKARQELGSGDVKDAIFHAGKSFESVMKVMTGIEHANADQLIKAMLTQDYFADLPESTRVGFAEQVMKTLPFLRNKLAGHGQGAEIIDVPVIYGELAMQLAATFHNFLISKHLERKPPEVEKSPALTRAMPAIDDDIPF
jgi:hypothetical protein